MYVYSLERMLGSWRECILLERMHSYLSQSDLCDYVYLKECRALWRECRALGENAFSWRECTASSFRVSCVLSIFLQKSPIFSRRSPTFVYCLFSSQKSPTFSQKSPTFVYCLFFRRVSRGNWRILSKRMHSLQEPYILSKEPYILGGRHNYIIFPRRFAGKLALLSKHSCFVPRM